MQAPNLNFSPTIIQGGMGAGVSGWKLARAVSLTGQLGVVSGTALDQILVRKLQMGDPGGHLRRAMSFFPDLEMVDRIEDAFFLPMGKPGGGRFKAPPMFSLRMPQLLQELTVVAAFSEVFLAKEGHDRAVGINLLEKIQLPNIFTIYGAMLADVDFVFMGAGIPNEIPAVIDGLARHQDVSLKIDVQGKSGADGFRLNFSPRAFMPKKAPELKRPWFFPIITSSTLARMMFKKTVGGIDGFIVESSQAGGHNAPPRGKLILTQEGEPVYGERDDIEIAEIKALGLPFWLAGAWGTPEKLTQALSAGAEGIQAGTVFAFCEEAGLTEQLKRQAIESILFGQASVFTDAKASPTHFPFKVLRLKNSLSEPLAYLSRTRICDLGYLREIYAMEDGSIGYRCPAEPVDTFLKKGGKPGGTDQKKCLCNALLSNIGLGQRRKDGYVEKALITAGKDILAIAQLLQKKPSYSAADVVEWLLADARCGELTTAFRKTA
jgi:nitronate monooxygenase